MTGGNIYTDGDYLKKIQAGAVRTVNGRQLKLIN